MGNCDFSVSNDPLSGTLSLGGFEEAETRLMQLDIRYSPL